MRTAAPVVCLVLSLVLASCHQASRAEEEPAPVKPPKAFEVTFRIHDGDLLLQSSRFPVLPGQRAVWQVENQLTGPDDFDVEIACPPMFGDPIMDVVVEGIRVSGAAESAADGRRIALEWRTETDEPGTMTQGREARIVIVLLPDVEARVASGRVLLEPGVATRLTRIVSGGRELDLSVSVVALEDR